MFNTLLKTSLMGTSIPQVDCFSFGMFLYEVLTTHQPYELCDNVKEHVLEGGRPALTHRETDYPVYVLDLMVMCWAQVSTGYENPIF